MPHDLHDLPRIEDGWSYLYTEHCKIDREDKAVALHDQDGKVSVPCASLALLLLGPGTSITHEAIKLSPIMAVLSVGAEKASSVFTLSEQVKPDMPLSW